MLMDLLVCWITGVIVGIVLSAVIVTVKSSFATFRIDTSNPEQDVYRFDVHGELTNVPKKKWIIVSVDANADLSQK